MATARRSYPPAKEAAAELRETVSAVARAIEELPSADNATGAVTKMLRANAILRNVPWPAPFDKTVHRFRAGDARDLSWLADESVHLVVTSPPYWTLKEYEPHQAQLGAVEDYEAFLSELDKVWRECARLLAPGGRICCVVGDVCVARKQNGRHHVMPLHADIQVRARLLGLDCLTPILWQKIANGATEVEGNGAGFYGKPYQPGAIIKNDIEYILFLRKGGKYRSPSTIQRALSMLNREEMQSGCGPSGAILKGNRLAKAIRHRIPSRWRSGLSKCFPLRATLSWIPSPGPGPLRWRRSFPAATASASKLSRSTRPLPSSDYVRLRGCRAKPEQPKRRWCSNKKMPGRLEFALLNTFRHLFEGTRYKHRDSSLGDLVASQLYEDLVALNRSPKLTARVQAHERVVNLANEPLAGRAAEAMGHLANSYRRQLLLQKPACLSLEAKSPTSK